MVTRKIYLFEWDASNSSKFRSTPCLLLMDCVSGLSLPSLIIS